MTEPQYRGPFDPVHPCRIMHTRHCPASYLGPCPADQPCARYESEDPTPWYPEMPSMWDRAMQAGLGIPRPTIDVLTDGLC